METNESSTASRPAGYAAIALASAAGVIAASSMSRPALALAAGLAIAWWRKQQKTERLTPTPSQQPAESDSVPMRQAKASQMMPLESFQEWQPPAQEVESSLPTQPLPKSDITVFPEAPIRPEAPLTDAWNDLRAAFSPMISSSSKPKEIPEEAVVVVHELPMTQAPEMPELMVSMPSSPLLDVEVTEAELEGADFEDAQSSYLEPMSAEQAGEIPDEISLPPLPEDAEPGLKEKASASDDPPPTLLVRSFAAPVVIPRADYTPPLESPSITCVENPKPLTAPIVLPREAQAKKSFFDWLRS
jgi:hypothetical protein